MHAPTREPLTRPVQFFTGKGGVGKSTVLGGIAMAASRAGRQPLIVELGIHTSSSHLFRGPNVGYEPSEVARGVFATRVAEEAFLPDAMGEPDTQAGADAARSELAAARRIFEHLGRGLRQGRLGRKRLETYRLELRGLARRHGHDEPGEADEGGGPAPGEGEDEDGDGNGEFTPDEKGEADLAWIAYIVAEK